MNRSEFLHGLDLTPSSIVGRLTGRLPEKDIGQEGFAKGKVAETLFGAGSAKVAGFNRLFNTNSNTRNAVRLLPYVRASEIYMRALGLKDQSEFMLGDPLKFRNNQKSSNTITTRGDR